MLYFHAPSQFHAHLIRFRVLHAARFPGTSKLLTGMHYGRFFRFGQVWKPDHNEEVPQLSQGLTAAGGMSSFC